MMGLGRGLHWIAEMAVQCIVIEDLAVQDSVLKQSLLARARESVSIAIVAECFPLPVVLIPCADYL